MRCFPRFASFSEFGPDKMSVEALLRILPLQFRRLYKIRRPRHNSQIDATQPVREYDRRRRSWQMAQCSRSIAGTSVSALIPRDARRLTGSQRNNQVQA
jgi:hypothetical protein